MWILLVFALNICSGEQSEQLEAKKEKVFMDDWELLPNPKTYEISDQGKFPSIGFKSVSRNYKCVVKACRINILNSKGFAHFVAGVDDPASYNLLIHRS